MDLKWKEVKREKGQTSAGVRNGEVTELNVFCLSIGELSQSVPCQYACAIRMEQKVKPFYNPIKFLNLNLIWTEVENTMKNFK